MDAFLVENAGAGREVGEIEDECETSRRAATFDTDPVRGLREFELGGAGAGLDVSPARSARVFRFNPLTGGAILVWRALVAAADISKSSLGERIFVGGRMPEVNCDLHGQKAQSTPPG